MKTILFVFSILVLALMIYSSKGPRPQKVHEPLPEGEVTPPLRRIGIEGKLPADGRMYLRTNYTSVGKIVNTSRSHEFPDGRISDAVLVQWNDGTRIWVERYLVSQSWIEDEAASPGRKKLMLPE